jgi:hypothetical protein
MAAASIPKINSGENVRTKTIVSTLALCFVAVTMSFAANPNIGTWKLDGSKSKIPPMAPKNNTVVYEAAGDNVKSTVDDIDGKGNPFHSEWTGKFDGKDYPLTGDPTADTRSYKKIDDHTTELINKKDGKVTATGRIVVSADGKTRTLTVSGTDPSGKKIKYAAIYDKQ